jgi:hypothetical protein
LSSEAIDLKAARPPLPLPPPPPGPTPDEVTWAFLKEMKDEAALRRFIQEYPKSPLRAEADARIAALALEAQKAKAAAPPPAPPGPSSEELAWSLVKDSKDPEQLRRFVGQFPDSPHRPEAAQRMAALTVEAEKAKTPSEPQIDRREIARSLQLELKRLGCFDGSVNGDFGISTRAALRNFAKLAAVSVPDNEPSLDALKAVRGFDKRICPLSCPTGERADGERCIRIVCPVGQFLKDGSCIAKPQAAEPKKRVTEPAPRSAPRPPSAGSGKCFNFQGRQFCE